MTLTLTYASPKNLEASSAESDVLAGTKYSLKLINNAAQPWTFYVYQKMPAQVADVFSLAWFASPYKIVVGNFITFRWEINYNFVWGDTGTIIPGVTFDAGGTQSASPADDNTTIFSLNPGPHLSAPIPGDPKGSLVIQDGDDVPNNRYSVGIGMSGTGTYVVQAGTGLRHTFTPTPSYWVAAGANVQIGTVLNIQTITQTAEAKYGNQVFDLVGTLNDNNKWTFEPA